jgi:hypothetical protein
MSGERFNVEEMYDELRRHVLETLKQEVDRDPKHRGRQPSIDRSVLRSLDAYETAPEREKQRMEALVCQIFHELYLERVIVPGTGDLNPMALPPRSMDWPGYWITEHGRRVLQTREYSPYDPDGYLRRLRSDIPSVDETIVRYVAESLQCLRMDCLLAAVVTIGCASEKAVLLLIDEFGRRITDPQKKQEYEKQTSTWIISRKYEVFRDSLDRVAKDLPRQLRDALEPQLHGTFDLIRRIRNDAGHPTGEPVTRDMILASHIVFPGYCKYVYSLKDHFTQHVVNL